MHPIYPAECCQYGSILNKSNISFETRKTDLKKWALQALCMTSIFEAHWLLHVPPESQKLWI